MGCSTPVGEEQIVMKNPIDQPPIQKKKWIISYSLY